MAEECKVGVVPTKSDTLLLFLSLYQINNESKWDQKKNKKNFNNLSAPLGACINVFL